MPGARVDTIGMVAGWHPLLRRIVDAAVAFPVEFRSARPVEPWDCPGVTLLGDAIHTMPPSQAVREYETGMLRLGFEAVADSLDKAFSTVLRTAPTAPAASAAAATVRSATASPAS
ncbi:hypothetical protein [Actinomadura sp. 9N215]|uniref:hypothetical protein n=1 Tax=Actinomadura sp. 9N215 TaxID=3375150 RepID=UPI00378EC20C